MAGVIPVLLGVGELAMIEGLLATLPAGIRGGRWARAQQAWAQQARLIHGPVTPPRSREV